MKWTKISLKTTTSAEDLVIAVLDEMGIEGVQVEDNIQLSEEDKKRMFIDILPELPPDEGKAVLSFYTDEATDISTLENDILDNLKPYASEYDLGELTFEISSTEDTDWINNWKQFFKPFRADDNIIIKPTWTDISELTDIKNEDTVIEIDPGTAFGTGAHETTKLCIHALGSAPVKGNKICDIGCGSGILSIVGIKLGAEYAFGVDVDENCAHIAEENCSINNIGSDKVAFITGNVLEDEELCRRISFTDYRVVVANILADIIIPLSNVLGRYLKKDTVFISSGIINTKEEAVRQALVGNGFLIKQTDHMNDWVAFTAVKS